MRFRKPSVDGKCFTSCVSNLMGIREQDVFSIYSVSRDTWVEEFSKWAESLGWEFTYPWIEPSRYFILIYETVHYDEEKNEFINHAVIWDNENHILFDPAGAPWNTMMVYVGGCTLMWNRLTLKYLFLRAKVCLLGY